MIEGNHNNLLVGIPIAVYKILPILFARLLLVKHFEVALAIIDENPNLTDRYFAAFLDPYDLPIMIHRLHAVTRHTDTEICSIRDCMGWDRYQFKAALI